MSLASEFELSFTCLRCFRMGVPVAAAAVLDLEARSEPSGGAYFVDFGVFKI